MSEARFLGIDFSGGAGPWKANCAKRRQTVWIAELEGFKLAKLYTVQDLDGEGEPFDKLAALLRQGRFRAAGIDAPFSLPARHVPEGGHKQLMASVGALPPGDDRPFPKGPALIAMAKKTADLESQKPHRETEKACSGANPRSTLWWKPRGGAPFAAACITLLHQAQRPVWPWKDAPGMLVEAFPAAQLRTWELPHSNYAAADESPARAKIVAGLERKGVDILPEFRKEMLSSPDALDAVVAVFAGRAAANRQLKHPLPSAWELEGAIAVHK